MDEQGRVIDRSAGDRTTSEGEAYAMFFALVDDDRTHFDKALNWTEANLAGGDLTVRLPAWEWGRNSAGEWKTLDANSASDADLWMAYSLMQAGRLWREPRYEKLGRIMALQIAKQEIVLVPGLGTTLAPGPSGFHPEVETWIINPSYMPLPVLAYFAKSFPAAPWAQVLESLPEVAGGSSSHGFVMDWVKAGPAGVHPSAPPTEASSGMREPHDSGSGSTERQGWGSFDAIRFYLWLGLADAKTPERGELLAQTGGMGEYLRTALIPPLEVDAAGKAIRAEGPPGFSAAVIPYLGALGLRAESRVQQDRVLATQDGATQLLGRPAGYYDQNLVLFSTGFTEQRYRFERDGTLRVKWK